jgi:two-component system cell cycle response regulator DivK
MNRPSLAVLEDDEQTLELYRTLFSKAGYDVVTTSTAQELVSLLEKRGVDAIVMDLGLPDGRGVALCRRLRSVKRLMRVPIIAVTGWSEGVYTEGLAEAPFNEVFTKPVDPLLLLESLHRWGVGVSPPPDSPLAT